MADLLLGSVRVVWGLDVINTSNCLLEKVSNYGWHLTANRRVHPVNECRSRMPGQPGANPNLSVVLVDHSSNDYICAVRLSSSTPHRTARCARCED